MATDSDVRCRVDKAEKDAANEVFERMGMTMSEGIRMFLRRVVEEKAIPFEVRVPNRDTVAAISEARRGEARKFESVSSLKAWLDADDWGHDAD